MVFNYAPQKRMYARNEVTRRGPHVDGIILPCGPKTLPERYLPLK